MSAIEAVAKTATAAKSVVVAAAVLSAAALAVYVGVKGYGLARKARRAADAVGAALDPTADTNLAYRASNALVGCGDGSCSIGTKIYDAVDTVRGWMN